MRPASPDEACITTISRMQPNAYAFLRDEKVTSHNHDHHHHHHQYNAVICLRFSTFSNYNKHIMWISAILLVLLSLLLRAEQRTTFFRILREMITQRLSELHHSDNKDSSPHKFQRIESTLERCFVKPQFLWIDWFSIVTLCQLSRVGFSHFAFSSRIDDIDSHFVTLLQEHRSTVI